MLRDVTVLESRSTGFAYAVPSAVLRCGDDAALSPASTGRSRALCSASAPGLSPPSTAQVHDFLVSDAPRQPHSDLPGRRQGHRLLRVRTNHRGVVEHHPHLLGDCGNIGINIDTGAAPDYDVLLGCLRERFGEIIALGDDSGSPAPG